MKNIEIKSRLPPTVSVKEFHQRLLSNPQFGEERILYQIDTFLGNPEEREGLLVKLRQQREKDGVKMELVTYRRGGMGTGTMESDYDVVPVGGTEEAAIRVFSRGFGPPSVAVSKTRHLFMYKQTRIHFDLVKDLGAFCELETVMPAPPEQCEEVATMLGLTVDLRFEVPYMTLLSSKDEDESDEC